jgi:phasin family protein
VPPRAPAGRQRRERREEKGVMAKSSNPFWNFDFAKSMGDFNPAKMTEEFTKMAGQYKFPGMDVQALMKSQQKNIEALTAANRTAAEGLQAILKRQSEIFKGAMDEVAAAVEAVGKSGSPQAAAAKQAEVAKGIYEKAFANMREIAEMMAKCNAEAGDAINARVCECLDEMKEQALKYGK